MTSTIYKVLTGKASKAEHESLYDWVARSEQNKNEFEALRLLWENCQSTDRALFRDVDFYNNLYKIRSTIGRLKQKAQDRRNIFIDGTMALMMIFLIALAYLSPLKRNANAGNMKFDNTSMENIINKLETKYSININASNDILSCRFTGTFSEDIEASRVLQTLAKTMNLDYVIIDTQNFLLSGKKCA